MVNHGKPVTIWFVHSFGWFLKPLARYWSCVLTNVLGVDHPGTSDFCGNEIVNMSIVFPISPSTPSKKAVPEASTCFDCQGPGFLGENTGRSLKDQVM